MSTSIRWLPEAVDDRRDGRDWYRSKESSLGAVFVVVEDILWVIALAHTKQRPGFWADRSLPDNDLSS